MSRFMDGYRRAWRAAGAVLDEHAELFPAPDPGQAMAFTCSVLQALDGDHPPAFVLDVAELADGSWTMIEANASWSSAPYHADPSGVVRSILASQVPGADPRWAWVPDPVLLARALPLRLSPTAHRSDRRDRGVGKKTPWPTLVPPVS